MIELSPGSFQDNVTAPAAAAAVKPDGAAGGDEAATGDAVVGGAVVAGGGSVYDALFIDHLWLSLELAQPALASWVPLAWLTTGLIELRLLAV